MTRRRKLREEELRLWQDVTRTASPLDTSRKKTRMESPDDPKRRAAPKEAHTSEPLSPFGVGQKARPTQSVSHRADMSVADRLNAEPVSMDFKTYKKMRRGKLKPEARLDLHGMTAMRAHGELNRFILNAQGAGKRLVLVITGKGRRSADDGPIPQRIGILRHEVPMWLSQPPLAAFVQQVTAASDRHGGAGAYYVYLRRR